MVYKKIIAGLGVATALGIAALPVAGTFAESANVDVTVNVGATIAISAASPAAVSMTPGQKTSSNAANITVSTNSAGGYKLTVKDADTNTALVNANGTIPAVSGALEAGTAGWNITGGDLVNVAISTEDQTVKTNTNSTHTAIANDVTAMTYNFATGDAQVTGEYKDTIVYTATAL